MKAIPYHHVDVFSPEPFSGNGLIVFPETTGFSTATMQVLTQEMRQFESVFLEELGDNSIKARIFTCSEELDFAGHPVLGAAAVLHDQKQPNKKNSQLDLRTKRKNSSGQYRENPKRL